MNVRRILYNFQHANKWTLISYFVRNIEYCLDTIQTISNTTSPFTCCAWAGGTPVTSRLRLWSCRINHNISATLTQPYRTDRHICRSPNWNEPRIAMGTPQIGILKNPYPNWFGDPRSDMGSPFWVPFQFGGDWGQNSKVPNWNEPQIVMG